MDLASLGVRLDTSGVKSGATDLDKLADSAERAETATEGVGPAVDRSSRHIFSAKNALRGAALEYDNYNSTIARTTLSTKQYEQAMRLVPVQITDIVTSLASGSPAYMVAIQQGGQLRDSFGSLSGAARALLTTIGPVGGAVLALGGTAAAVAYGFYQGQKEGFEFEKAIAMTGNAAGTTAGQLALMADRVGDVVGTTSSAAKALAEIAGSGRIAGDSLEQVAIIAQQLEKQVGQPVSATVKILEELAKEPTAASAALNEQYGYLTATVYEQIRALEKQGKVNEAGALAQQAYLSEASERAAQVEQHLGLFQRLGDGIAGAFGKAKSALAGLGRGSTDEERLKELTEARGGRELFTGDIRNTFSDQEEERLRASVAAAQARAQAQAEEVANSKKYIADRELQERTSIAQRASDDALEKARLGTRNADIQRELNSSLSHFQNYSAVLEAERKANLITEEEYYYERRRLIEEDRDAQLQALEAESKLLAAERTRIEANATSDRAKPRSPEDALKQEASVQQALIDNQRKQLDNEAQIGRARDAAESQLKSLNIETKASGDAISRAFDESRIAAESYLATVARQQNRRIEALGQGTRQREFSAGLDDIENRFTTQRQELERDKRNGVFNGREQQYQNELATLKEFQERETAQYEKYWDTLTEKQNSFYVGASEAVANYLDSTRNVAQLTEQALSNAFSSLEDSLANFVVTGKLNFKDLANSIMADIARIQVKALLAQASSSLLSGLAGLFGGGGAVAGAAAGASYSGPRAEGGPVDAGRSYLVGERGPEIFVPHGSGTVIPNHSMAGTTVQISSPITMAPGNNGAELDAMLRRRNDELEAKIYQNLDNGRWNPRGLRR